MSKKNTVTMTFGYADTDYTRNYKFDNLTDDQLSGLKDRVLALNTSLADDESIKEFFISDNGENFSGIVALKSDSVQETIIPLNG